MSSVDASLREIDQRLRELRQDRDDARTRGDVDGEWAADLWLNTWLETRTSVQRLHDAAAASMQPRCA